MIYFYYEKISYICRYCQKNFLVKNIDNNYYFLLTSKFICGKIRP